MATRRYSITPNNPPYNVVEAVGAATVSGPVEVTIDLAAVMQGNTVAMARVTVLEQLQKIVEYIERGNWPPA